MTTQPELFSVESQEKKILNYLRSGKTLTSLEALNKFRCFRLASRVSHLNKMGHNIVATMVHDKQTGKRFASYKLIK